MKDSVHDSGVEQRILSPRPRRVSGLDIRVLVDVEPVAQARENENGMAPLEDVQSNQDATDVGRGVVSKLPGDNRDGENPFDGVQAGARRPRHVEAGIVADQAHRLVRMRNEMGVKGQGDTVFELCRVTLVQDSPVDHLEQFPNLEPPHPLGCLSGRGLDEWGRTGQGWWTPQSG